MKSIGSPNIQKTSLQKNCTISMKSIESEYSKNEKISTRPNLKNTTAAN